MKLYLSLIFIIVGFFIKPSPAAIVSEDPRPAKRRISHDLEVDTELAKKRKPLIELNGQSEARYAELLQKALASEEPRRKASPLPRRRYTVDDSFLLQGTGHTTPTRSADARCTLDEVTAVHSDCAILLPKSVSHRESYHKETLYKETSLQTDDLHLSAQAAAIKISERPCLHHLSKAMNQERWWRFMSSEQQDRYLETFLSQPDWWKTLSPEQQQRYQENYERYRNQIDFQNANPYGFPGAPYF